MPFLVRDRLYIGDIIAANQTLTVDSSSVTHILSLLTSNLSTPAEEIKKVFVSDMDDHERRCLPKEGLLYKLEKIGVDLRMKRMIVELKDVEEENLLDYLDVCLDFIEEGRKDGHAILVHCFAGVSRSAAVVTAYLMRTEQKSREDALNSLREVCESACPNDSFLEQLDLFENMGFKVDTSSPLYKSFRLKELGHSYNQGEKVDSSKFETDPGSHTNSNNCNSNLKSVYRCKKCRRIVAVEENVVSHTPSEGKCFSRQRKKNGNTYKDVGCTSLFVEPLKWMTTVEEGAVQGKLSCIKCDARLGYYNWYGTQCSCGTWVTPAFQIHKNRVDVSSECYNLN